MNTIFECDNKIEQMFIDARLRISDYIDMLHIQAVSSFEPNKFSIDKGISSKLITEYLKKKGYDMNYILNRGVMVKGFTCVYIGDGYVEVWHDIPNSKPFFISQSLLTGLPITLKYMERI